MHNKSNIYYFINSYNSDEIKKLKKNVSLIYRDYEGKLDLDIIKKIRNICILQKRKFYISNNLKVAKNLKLDGVYIPSFNNLSNFKNLTVHNQFKIIGSAHNRIELLNKMLQGCSEVFIAPLFKTKKSKFFLDISKFNLISNHSDIKIIALGGINSSNFDKLKTVKCSGFAAITWIKKTGLNK
jgi:thiamine-phosphate pyrophosphorylase|tara:strand:+ start:2705 stop:3253 length:549 start_codon:yes stop_codon:yes gene_type:complete